MPRITAGDRRLLSTDRIQPTTCPRSLRPVGVVLGLLLLLAPAEASASCQTAFCHQQYRLGDRARMAERRAALLANQDTESEQYENAVWSYLLDDELLGLSWRLREVS